MNAVEKNEGTRYRDREPFPLGTIFIFHHFSIQLPRPAIFHWHQFFFYFFYRAALAHLSLPLCPSSSFVLFSFSFIRFAQYILNVLYYSAKLHSISRSSLQSPDSTQSYSDLPLSPLGFPFDTHFFLSFQHFPKTATFPYGKAIVEFFFSSYGLSLECREPSLWMFCS